MIFCFCVPPFMRSSVLHENFVHYTDNIFENGLSVGAYTKYILLNNVMYIFFNISKQNVVRGEL